MQSFPISNDDWHAALEQRQLENEAQEIYHIARQNLFDILKPSGPI